MAAAAAGGALPGFEFSSGRLVFGRGAADRLPELVAELAGGGQGGARVFLVAGSSDRLSAPVAAALAAQGVATTTFHVAKEPTVELVQEATARAKAGGCGMVIGLGGGAVIDTGKVSRVTNQSVDAWSARWTDPLRPRLFPADQAVSAMLSNGGDAPDPLDFLEVVGRGLPITEPSVPYIACPTTAGVGRWVAEACREGVE